MNMKMLLAAAVLAAAAAGAHADDHADCPMHAAHTARRDAVDHRHDDATGVHHEHAEHHFLINPDGGTIRLEARDAADTKSRDRIREHLQAITKAFAAENFAIPTRIHDEVPPGVEAMKKMKAAITYTFAPTDKGGEVRITTKDADALAAIHAFMRFQVEDHGTGDPTE
jgi:hypothetical protein